MGVVVREYKGRPGVWGVFIHHRGRRTSKLVGPSKRDAEAIARDVRKELAAGDLGVLRDRGSTVPTFEAYAETFLARAEKRLKPSSSDNYRDAVGRYLQPRIGPLPLDGIEDRHLRPIIAEMEAAGRAAATIRCTLWVASAIFRRARKDKLVKANPVTDLSDDLPRNRPPEIEPRTRRTDGVPRRSEEAARPGRLPPDVRPGPDRDARRRGDRAPRRRPQPP